MSIFTRKRKTKAPCAGCGLHQSLCICDQIPLLNLRTRVCLVIHAKELKRTTNTGRLATNALMNSEMRVRGASKESLDLSDLLTPSYRSVLFYPSLDSVELSREWVDADPKPIQLIVPDGNWRQASKVSIRHPELTPLPRVRMGATNDAIFHLRKESRPEGMATLQAIAHALGVIEGEAVRDRLLALYELKLTKTLQARGQL